MALPTLSDVHIQAALSNLSIAYRQSAPPVATRVFPLIPVDKKSDKYYIWDKGDMWRSEIRGARAPGTHFDRVGLRLSTDTYVSEQYALEYLLPDEIVANQDAAVDVETTAAEYLVAQQNLKMDLAWATAYMSSGAGWGSGSAVAKWSTTAGKPTTDVTGAVRTIRRAIGATQGHRFVGVCGTIVEVAALNNADVMDRLKYTGPATVENIRQALAAVLGLDELIVVDREYNTAKEGVTASYSPVVDDDLLVVAVPTSPGLMTSAAGMTFAWNEGGKGSMYVQRYRSEEVMSDVLRNVAHWGFKQTGAALGVFFSDITD